jgi:serine/threonine protein kinase
MSLKSAPFTNPSSKAKDRELLGQGRFGQVYRGVFRDKPVAIKKIQRTLLGPGEDKELSIMKKLHHPNVLRLISVEDKGEFMWVGALTLRIHTQQ